MTGKTTQFFSTTFINNILFSHGREGVGFDGKIKCTADKSKGSFYPG